MSNSKRKLINSLETDWLNSDPVFYNEKTGKISRNINDLIEVANFEFHPEGFNNYLEFGYSVFEQTPIKGIKFLQHSSQVKSYDDGSLEVTNSDSDIADNFFGKESREEDVIELTKSLVEKWEGENQGELLIPLSGGYDSRMLAMFVKDVERARSFTFGLSLEQEKSFEVLYAKEMARVLGIKWDIVQLGDYHNFIDAWDDMYGISVHTHGMYHIEFYSNLIKKIGKTMPMISGGLNGSIWAGEITIDKISHPNNLAKLAHSHGLCGNKEQSLLKGNSECREKFWEENRDKLDHMFYRLLWSCRMKNIMLNYVVKVPDSLGFKPCAPYNDANLALGMLNLPFDRWKDRKWQVDLFRKNKIFVEDYIKKPAMENLLDIRAIHNVRPEPLDPDLLGCCVNKDYVEWINKNMSSGLVKRALTKTSKIKFFRKKKEKLRDRVIKAYNAYLTLRPVQNLLKKRLAL